MPDKKPKEPKSQPLSTLLEGSARIAVETLMPITLIWHDFLQKHEYVDPSVSVTATAPQIMQLVDETMRYVNGIYKYLGVTQEQFDEIADKISPMLYPDPKKDEPPHPDKDGESQPEAVKL